MTRGSLKFARVVQLLKQNYVQPVDPNRVILEGAVRGMLASLDPFSSFFNRDQFKMLQQETRGKTLGFGSILSVQPGRVMVLQTQRGSPSWRAGLGPGDQITAVNGRLLDDLGLRSLIALLRGARSHPVRLSVLRPGDVQAQNFNLVPAQVAMPTVDTAFAYSNGIGYIHLTSFENKTPQEMVSAFRRLDAPHLKGLILDLRGNPGGVLQSAVQVCSLFLKPGDVVLTVRGRAVPEKIYRTGEAPMRVTVPLIVLVNGRTASAAEVVSAALQDHDRAVIAGERTFGKGVVESVMPLSAGTGLALLTAEYFTPSGRSIQRPLPGTALKNPIRGLAVSTRDAAPVYHTDDGRLVTADGGVTPDFRIPVPQPDPWLQFLTEAGMFSSFASEYFTYHSKITKAFEPSEETLEEFRNFLSAQRIRSPKQYWLKDQNELKNNLRVALLTLAFGLNYGNEVTARTDPQIEKAVALLPRVPALLKGPPKRGIYARAEPRGRSAQ